MKRTFNYEILPQIKTRWSSRSISPENLRKEDILSLLEAARYAPSCFNEQPWRYIIADTEPALLLFRGCLTPQNQVWAGTAPVLLALCSKKQFGSTGKDNYWNMFDSGTSWGYLSLEAERRGFVAHAMAGFDRVKAREVLNVPDDYEIITFVAIGKPGEASRLPADIAEREIPGTRMNIEDIVYWGTFK